jgi:Lrp/AsnC family leucine-responsive transcriptional regulator
MIDDIDRTIIRTLYDRGRVSFRDLAEQIHLSPNAAAGRVRRLVERRVIKGFHADVDLAQVGLSLHAYIDVKLLAATNAKKFEASVATLAGVVSVEILTGTFDLRLKVACRNQEDLIRVIEDIRSKEGVQETNSTLICRRATAYGLQL